MIKREFFNKPTDAFFWVETILARHKEYYLSKEEIYSKIPKDEDGVCIVRINALENALYNLCKTGHICFTYHSGCKYYAYMEEVKRYD